jgi:hypothetical protein
MASVPRGIRAYPLKLRIGIITASTGVVAANGRRNVLTCPFSFVRLPFSR